MSHDKQMIMNAFLMTAGHHEASWRLPDNDARGSRDVTYFQDLARTAERGLLDSVFFADGPLLWDVGRRPSETVDPTLLLTAMAVVTERIGLIATATTTFEEPFNLARKFASLDLISKGRAGWNMVTTGIEAAAANFGDGPLPTPAERYSRGAEFLDVVLGLWGGWDDDAVVADKARGRLHRPVAGAPAGPPRRALQRGRAAQRRPQPARPPGHRAGGLLACGHRARREVRRGGVHRAADDRGGARLLRDPQGRHGEGRAQPRPHQGAAGHRADPRRHRGRGQGARAAARRAGRARPPAAPAGRADRDSPSRSSRWTSRCPTTSARSTTSVA